VDDEEVIRSMLARMLTARGYEVGLFESAESFLSSMHERLPSCILLDVFLPEMSGLETQRRLLELRTSSPVILMSGRATVPMAVEAMRIGAFDVLEKPLVISTLCERVAEAVERSEQVRQIERERLETAELYETLTPRESEVLRYVVAGLPARTIGQRLGISSRTVDVHRARIIRKMKASSVTHLVRLTAALRGGPLQQVQT
jgi:two-component system response regulator FixJ